VLSPFLPLLQLRDANDVPIDGRREGLEKSMRDFVNGKSIASGDGLHLPPSELRQDAWWPGRDSRAPGQGFGPTPNYMQVTIALRHILSNDYRGGQRLCQHSTARGLWKAGGSGTRRHRPEVAGGLDDFGWVDPLCLFEAGNIPRITVGVTETFTVIHKLLRQPGN
jgi:hypothetical protein